jgi:hypothetical protein
MGRIKKIRLENIIDDITENINKNFDDDKKYKESKKKEVQRERELIINQLDNIPIDRKLRPTDIYRIVQHTSSSLFDKEKCCLWEGYITNLKNKKKGTYINFYFKNKKKVALHRLLYENYRGHIDERDYIKYSCPNKGKCCNVNHMVRFKYTTEEKDDDKKKEDEKNDKNDYKGGKKKNNKKGRKSRKIKNDTSSNSSEEFNFKITIM